MPTPSAAGHAESVIWINPSGTETAGTSVSAFVETLGDRAQVLVKGLEVWRVDPDQPYGMDVEVEGVARLAAEAAFNRYHVFGFSAGGTVALACALALGGAVR